MKYFQSEVNNALLNHELQIPEIYCAITISFDKDVSLTPILDVFKKIEIYEYTICTPKCENIIAIDFAIIKNEKSWYLDDVLTKMFSKVENRLIALKELAKIYNGHICIDISFHQYGTYPALVFSGENMEKIHYLNADISIDPY